MPIYKNWNDFDTLREKTKFWLFTEPEQMGVNFLIALEDKNLTVFFVENGAFYITSKATLLKSKCRISRNIKIVEIPEESYFEIDELNDWIIVENLLKQRDV